MRKAIMIIIVLFTIIFLRSSTSAFEPTYKFTDQLEDNESGLYYYDARYYSPAIGRFIQPDPLARDNPLEFLENPQALNPYAYAFNNPIRYIDPTGLSAAVYNAMPAGGWSFGDVMGEFNRVKAYYNGIGSLRQTYSCVEYAKRYVSEKFGITMGAIVNPNTLWNSGLDKLNQSLEKTNSDYIFVRHNNGGEFVLPNEGDLLIWTDNANGHIMVVTESVFNKGTNTGHVEIIDQNARDQAVHQYEVIKNDSGYSIMKNKNTPMAGWLSPVNKNNTLVTTQDQKQPPFFQRAWNGVKKFFNKIF